MDVTEKIAFIKTHDPDGAARLERLIGKRENLVREGNVYKEKFTERQFTLVFNPLLDATYERTRILEILSRGDSTIPAISEKIGLSREKVFAAIKDLMRKNLVEIAHHQERDATFRKK
ncbi:MAG TPA: helix-turn-helix domain-containing protein [Syntrophorhabdaceae bacterium]|nr:helix-turn-helix domain-containing protein [Syntrophorhabdaceae bacterium]